MLTRCAKAHSSSCSQIALVYLQPFCRNSLLKCVLHKWLLQGYRFLIPSCAGFPEPRKLTLRPSKSTFKAENFICSLSWSICSDFGAIRLWNVSRRLKSPKKNNKNSLFWHSWSSNVIEFSGNREPVYDFQLVINSNLGPNSHHFWDTGTYWLKSQILPTPSHLAPSFRMIPFEFMEKLYWSWN